MKRGYASLIALALATPVVGRAQVPTICGAIGTGPFAFVTVDQLCANLSTSILFDVQTGLFNLSITDLILGTGRIDELTATFKQDPFISFSAATSNFTGGPTEYSFYFGTPIDPGFYSRANSTASVSVTRGSGASATVGQVGDDEFVTVFGSNGLTLIPLGVDIGTGECTAGAASNTCRYPPPDGGPESNTFSPIFLDNLEVELKYTQTDFGSQVGFTGRAEVFAFTPIPEPTTVSLMAVGVVAILGGGIARRRRNS